MSDFRARSNAELLDAAFEIYRRHFAIFLAAGVVAALPMAIMQYTALSMVGRSAVPVMSMASLAGMQAMLGVSYLVMLFIAPFTEGVTVTASARAYRGEPVELADAVRAVFARPVAVLLAYWARFFIMLAGLLVVAIAGGILIAITTVISKTLGLFVMMPIVFLAAFGVMIAIWKRYFAVLPALLVEEKRVGDAMSRSKDLADGNGWRIVLLVGIVVLVVMTFGIMLGAIAKALLPGVLGALVYLFCVALVSQFSGIVLTLLYFDLRIRKEGYDIELLARSLDAPAAALPPDAAPTYPATA